MDRRGIETAVRVTRVFAPVMLAVLLLPSPARSVSEAILRGQNPVAGAGTVEGIVLDAETGQPSLDTVVNLSGNSESRRTTANSEGRFVFEGVGPGRYVLTPTKSGYVFWHPDTGAFGQTGRAIRIENAAQRLRGIELRVAKTGVITGRVTNISGAPVPSARVFLQRETYGEFGRLAIARTEPARVSLTDDRGEYRIFDAEPGEYHVVVEGSPISFRPGNVSPTTYYPGVTDPSSSIPVTLRPGEELRLKDMVRTQVPGTTLRLHLAETGGTNASPRREMFFGNLGAEIPTRPGEDPSLITLPAVSPGLFEAVVYWPTAPGRAYGLLSVDVGASALDVELKPRLASQVDIKLRMRSSEGKPDTATAVNCIRLHPESLRQLGQTQNCSRSDTTTFQIPDDRYRLQLLGAPAGSHIVEILGRNGETLSDGFQVNGSGTFQVVLSDDLSVAIAGVVRDASGQTITDAVVALVPDAPSRSLDHLYRTAISDVDGGFELSAVVPGKYHLFAWRQLNGAAYKNEDFMKKYEADGKAVIIGSNQRLSADITLSESRSK